MLKRHDVQAVILFSAIGVLMMLAMSYKSMIDIRDLQATLIISNENPTWISSSLTLEHYRLTESLARFVNETDHTSKNDVLSRLDIYWSRYGLLEAKYTKNIASINIPLPIDLPPDLHSEALVLTVARLQREGVPTLAGIESMITQLKPKDFSTYFNILAALDALADDVARFQITAFEHDRYLDQLQIALSSKLRNWLWYAYLSIGLGITLAGAVLVMLIRQKHNTAQQLKDFNAQLQAEVNESTRLTGELEYRVTHDDLSGLINRFGFNQEIEALLSAGAGKHGLCFVDLDMFKVINDTSGHAAGDALIQQIAQQLTEQLPNSAVVARFGGDEFLILLRNCERLEFEETVSRCFNQLRPYQFRFDGKHYDVTSSFGAVCFDAAEHSMQSLMEIVDTACYEAKRAGGARIQFHNNDDCFVESRRSELRLVSQIQHALNHDGFRLYYQPVTPLQSSSGANSWEILLRMIDNNDQVVSPGQFLEVAERFALASKIDRWVIEHVFSWLEKNADSMAQLNCININLSGRSVGDKDLLHYIEQMTSLLPVDTCRICFEITESAIVGENAREFLFRLKELGYQLALDDFGTGFSSFGYLESLPVDYIKIDGLFVRDIDTNKTHYEFVRAIEAVGKAMGKKTVAEYVENQQSFEILESLGVDYAQGYYIAQPTPIPASFPKKQALSLSA
jgi:diguanylate cyclase (GGDEF)-like protein